MGHYKINHNSVNKESLLSILQNKFKQYKVGFSKWPHADLYVDKSGSVGIMINIKEDELKIFGYCPNVLLRSHGSELFFHSSWKAFEKEITDVLIECGTILSTNTNSIKEESEINPINLQPNLQQNINIENPEKHHNDITELSDKLIKLKDLLDKGILTKEEFDSEKAKILNS